MNELFVNVKVDREERPGRRRGLHGRGRRADRPGRLADDGLPDTRRRAVLRRHVLTRPSRGTGCRRSGRSSSRSPATLPRAARRRRASRLRRSSTRCGAARPRSRRRASRSPTRLLAEAERATCRAQFDPQWGGSAARRSSRPPRRSSSSCGAACFDLALGTLDGMARRRACTTSSAAASTATRSTREWLVPHFEKMLYDNALLVPAYLHAWAAHRRDAATGDRRGDRRVRASASCGSTGGGFASAQDADTDGVEG